MTLPLQHHHQAFTVVEIYKPSLSEPLSPSGLLRSHHELCGCRVAQIHAVSGDGPPHGFSQGHKIGWNGHVPPEWSKEKSRLEQWPRGRCRIIEPRCEELRTTTAPLGDAVISKRSARAMSATGASRTWRHVPLECAYGEERKT